MERLSKNFIWIALANVVSGLFTILILIYLARVLQPTAFGSLSYAQAYIFYLLSFVDLGLMTYGIREIAKDKARVASYVSEIVSIRFIAASVITILFISITFLTRHPMSMKLLMAENCLLFFMSALATEWAFQGIEKMHMVFISLATTTLFQLGLIYTFVKSPEDLLKVPVLYFIGAIPMLSIFLNHFRFRFTIMKEDIIRIRSYLSTSIVIWSISIFAQVYNGLDIILLGLFRSPEEVGYFSVARRVVGGVTLFMLYLSSAVLPRFSFTFGIDAPQFKAAMRKFLVIVYGIIIFVLLPLIIFSRPLIRLTVGTQYLPVDLTFRVMVVGLMLVLANFPYSTALIAAGFEKHILKQSVGSAALSVAGNLVLMPQYGMMGAAVSFVFAEVLALAWVLDIYKNRIRH